MRRPLNERMRLLVEAGDSDIMHAFAFENVYRQPRMSSTKAAAIAEMFSEADTTSTFGRGGGSGDAQPFLECMRPIFGAGGIRPSGYSKTTRRDNAYRIQFPSVLQQYHSRRTARKTMADILTKLNARASPETVNLLKLRVRPLLTGKHPDIAAVIKWLKEYHLSCSDIHSLLETDWGGSKMHTTRPEDANTRKKILPATWVQLRQQMDMPRIEITRTTRPRRQVN